MDLYTLKTELIAIMNETTVSEDDKLLHIAARIMDIKSDAYENGYSYGYNDGYTNGFDDCKNL
jgi:hypothetical protein